MSLIHFCLGRWPRLKTLFVARWRTPSINVGLSYLRIFYFCKECVLMLPECLTRNCNRYIILFNGEPVDGKYVIIVRNKTTNNAVVIVSRIRCRHVLTGMNDLYVDLCTCTWLIICRIFVESKYIAIWLLTWLSCCRVGNVCNCFVNVCNCCICVSVPLLEFSVNSLSLSIELVNCINGNKMISQTFSELEQ